MLGKELPVIWASLSQPGVVFLSQMISLSAQLDNVSHYLEEKSISKVNSELKVKKENR